MNAVMLKMHEESKKEYEQKLKLNLEQFYDAAEKDDTKLMEEVAKKGAGIKMMLDHINSIIKKNKVA